MNKKLILPLVVFSLMSQSLLAGAVTCTSLFNSVPEQRTLLQQVSMFMLRFKAQPMSSAMAKSLTGSVETLLADTTGKRIENKATADTNDVTNAIASFKNKLQKLGLDLIDRDQRIPGRRNVTYTEYTRPFSVTTAQMLQMGFDVRPEMAKQPESKTTVKIRIRSYGTVDANKKSFGISDIEFANFTKERAFVELKFKDPSYAGAVFKPQMYMNKKYIQLFGTKEFVARFEEIKAETLAHLQISAKKTLDKKSVESMLDFVYRAHLEKLDLSIAAINLYERVAQSAVLPYHSDKDSGFDKKYGSVDKIELQMTFDQLVSLFIPQDGYMVGTGRYYHAYSPEQTVAEFKTPTMIAHHLERAQKAAKAQGQVGLVVTPEHAKEIDEILPGLKAYFEMMNDVIQKRDQQKRLDSGKWGVAIKNISQQIKDQIQAIMNFEEGPIH